MTAILATRRELIVAACAGIAAGASPALAQQHLGPPPHTKGPLIFLDYDQVELDAAYDQDEYAPNGPQILNRYATNSEAMRARIGRPARVSYGPSEFEKLDIYRAK